MIFYILVGVAVIVIATFIVLAWRDRKRSWINRDFGIGSVFAAIGFSAALLAIAGVLLSGLTTAFWHPIGETREVTRELRAIQAGDSFRGNFFLGSGYVNGQRVLNYIAKEEGYSELDYEYASDSRIFEDSDEPTVTQYTVPYGNEWIVPWSVGHGYQVDFHVPEGSVLEDYSITP